MKTIRSLVYLLVFGYSLFIYAQERSPINIFNPKDYGAESQNWSITQSNNRNIYVANNKGLLEYNGAKWSLYLSPNQTIIRAVEVIDDLIYTGSYRDFGYWKRDDFGVLNYTSLANELSIDFLEDEEFWNIHFLDNWILFQSLDRIHIYNKSTKGYNVINSVTSISSLFKVEENFYFQNINNGLYKIENGIDVLVSSDPIIQKNIIVNMYMHNNDLLVLTENNGFYKLNNRFLTKWDIEANTLLDKISVFSSIKLKDGSFILGSISDGIIHINSSGVVTYDVNQSKGLSNNTILSIHEDIDHNIWLGLDNGINCVNINSPYLIYYDKNGIIGSVYTSRVYNGLIYLGTNQGLFYKPLDSKTSFAFVKGTEGQVWCLEEINNQLFCGHNSGTFLINNEKAEKISSIRGTWQIKTIEDHSDLLIQGNYDGLYILVERNSKWQLRNKLKGFDISSRFFEFFSKSGLYVSHEYKGVFRLKLDDKLTKVESVFMDTLINKNKNSSFITYQDDLLYTNNKGVFKLNTVAQTFEKDSLFSSLINEENFKSGKLVHDKKTNRLWSFSSKEIKYLETSGLSGEKKIKTISFPADIRNEVTGYENITHLNDEKFLLGTTTGYIILDLDKIEEQNHEIAINKIAVSKLKNNDTVHLVKLNSKASFENDQNNIEISYNISEFLKTQKPEYRYKLEGMYDVWSDWNSEGVVFYENLPYGSYTFKVKGRVGNQVTLNTASFSFKIDRPWFLSNLAIAFYVLSILLFSLFMHNIYKRYYRKQRERLMTKTTREFELKELENKQQLMRFKNDKLREDIESKNRELGISTMNLIKKNEFLSSIKKELESVEEVKNIKHVVKIIDRNLNNNDDWNLFQEAFNNADKDFLKKIKSIHPALTSNDLRLCAYLRLNLSSKEIAPLLNISARSVEVKRYRLRKKMDLPHEASLSDYILEI
ncbi:triple tyrosine motif-containing protein [uncultured Algibacter sp.]|uniref:helix-turn-helix and ligand-binding sensor domain-containing protein n=1 Tax=uncultured Algibacter sp. TaxID=298659 RepID=UPI00263778D2|nr:triple tyrosine motif-containing protein [uncultured Algibacter sp.]